MEGGEKGYVLFRCDWERAEPPAGPEAGELCAWRDRLYRAGLVGVLPDGIGFGNVSLRIPGTGRFLVSGTGTGRFPTLLPEHMAEVLAYDAARNWLRCRGPVQASSESLSHAAVYSFGDSGSSDSIDSDPSHSGIAAVVHVHHRRLWDALLGRVPTTDPAAEAGTPEMAFAIEALLRVPAARREGLFVMGGHRDGLMAFGASLEEACGRVLGALERLAADRPQSAGEVSA